MDKHTALYINMCYELNCAHPATNACVKAKNLNVMCIRGLQEIITVFGHMIE